LHSPKMFNTALFIFISCFMNSCIVYSRSQGSSISVCLRTGRLSDRGSIPGRGKRFFL
jgi:hypothetical protein